MIQNNWLAKLFDLSDTKVRADSNEEEQGRILNIGSAEKLLLKNIWEIVSKNDLAKCPTSHDLCLPLVFLTPFSRQVFAIGGFSAEPNIDNVIIWVPSDHLFWGDLEDKDHRIVRLSIQHLLNSVYLAFLFRCSPATSAVQVSYQYDPRDRLVTLIGNGRTTAFQYDALGRRTNAVWPNETTAAYAYDEANQLLSLIHVSAATTIASFVYAYDLGGNRTNMITLEGTNSYGYDNRDWLTSAIYPDGSSQEFRYDPVGNRTNLLEIRGTSSVLTAYSYGSANRLLSSASAVEVNEYAYDGAGRLTNHVVNGQPRRFAYNYRGQMTVLHDKDERIFAYDFDGDGNRIRQSLNDCLETRFVYDGPNVILDLSAGGGSADGGNASNELVHASVNGLGIDQPIERIGFIAGQPRQRHVYHADALGSIVAMTDDAGTTVKTYTYEAFGKIRAETGLGLNRYTFTAREAIGDSRDLLYYRYRVMSPRTGRFTSFDSLGFVDGVNLYNYVNNSPVSLIDQYGLMARRRPQPQPQPQPKKPVQPWEPWDPVKNPAAWRTEFGINPTGPGNDPCSRWWEPHFSHLPPIEVIPDR